MTKASTSQLTIVADDLTGAADAAGAYGQTHSSAVVFDLDAPWPDAEIVAVDTESRYLPEREAARLVASVVHTSLSMGRPVFKKIDSLLRGNIGTEVAAALAELTRDEPGMAVVAPAFPATGRTTVGGVVHVGGVPHSSGPFGGDVAAALSAGCLKAGRATPTGRTPGELSRHLDARRTEGLDVVVLDADGDDDLECIARATELVAFPTLLTGSGGLASHVVPSRPRTGATLGDGFGMSRVLVVVGSYSTLANSQIRALLKHGVRHIELRLERPLDPQVLTRLAGLNTDVVLTPHLAGPVNKANALDVAAALAAAVSAVADDYDALILTGGETAKAVIDALGVDHMRVLGEIEPGVVMSEISDGRPYLVTKAGAFGDADTLTRIVRSLKAPTKTSTQAPTTEVRTRP